MWRPGRHQDRLRPDPELPPVSLPARAPTLLSAIAGRGGLALGLLVLATAIVYAERSGYLDAVRPRQPISLLAAAYYSTVTLSTTGYGDIVPVSTAARVVNILVITPIRVIFLVVLIGTTIEVLAERTRVRMRIARWRSKVTGHTIIAGYGTKGRSALKSLLEAGTPASSVVVIDISPDVMAEVKRVGLAGVAGDASRREVLVSAEVGRAARMVIAVGRDDTAVLITLTARQLSPALTIVAAVREAENESLLRQSGATEVVVSSDAAGRLLGLSATDPGASRVVAQLLDRGPGLELTERRVAAAEVGRPAGEVASGAVAVLRGDSVLALDDPRAGQLAEGDRVVLVSAAASRPQRRLVSAIPATR
jgi:voltage-gated potassium channel